MAHVENHYSDVIISAMASQIASLAIVYLTVNSSADQRKHQSSASTSLCEGNSPHKGPVTRKNVSAWWRHHISKADRMSWWFLWMLSYLFSVRWVSLISHPTYWRRSLPWRSSTPAWPHRSRWSASVLTSSSRGPFRTMRYFVHRLWKAQSA